jgi:cytochrome c553
MPAHSRKILILMRLREYSARLFRGLFSLLAISPAIALVFTCDAHAQSRIDEFAWAYAITPASAPTAIADDGTVYSLPESDRKFTRDQIRNRFGPADWYPGDHSRMPDIVAFGRESAGIWACSLCHYPSGQGRPENAGVAGLSKDYFIQQMRDFRNGRRGSADTRKANTSFMVAYASAMTDQEIEQAAEYFSSMTWRQWIEVVETDTVPKTRIQGGMHLRLEGEAAGTEPIGLRIIETPVDSEHTELLRDPRSGFIAYVPNGAIARGAVLAAGDGKAIRCSICHGEGLAGLGAVPTLRGRSPSYIARQLIDFQLGTRKGAWGPLMDAVVADLSAEDIVNLSAYLASLSPQP